MWRSARFRSTCEGICPGQAVSSGGLRSRRVEMHQTAGPTLASSVNLGAIAGDGRGDFDNGCAGHEVCNAAARVSVAPD